MATSTESFTISREDLVDVGSDAECILRIFAALSGRSENELLLRLGDLVDNIEGLGDADGLGDEIRLRGSEKTIKWLDEIAKDERKLLDERQEEAAEIAAEQAG
jgi:hypothetical protein